MTTYTAHIVTGEAHNLGDPEIFVELTDEDSEPERFVHYPMGVDDDPTAALESAGWNITGDLDTAEAQIEPGYYLVEVEPADWLAIVRHVTRWRGEAQAEKDRQERAWRHAVAQAVVATREGTAVGAAAGGISKQRVYQIRDEQR
ncbi:MAG TPA: hypothetical protein VIP77_05540 [Jiangellaceae bacterium]